MTSHQFQTAGALPRGSPLYVVRTADSGILPLLDRMAYVTIIEPRQQGKTSFLNHLSGLGRHAFCYVDMLGLSRSSESDWYHQLGDELQAARSHFPVHSLPDSLVNGEGWKK